MVKEFEFEDSVGDDKEEIMKKMTDLRYYPIPTDDTPDPNHFVRFSIKELLRFGGGLVGVIEAIYNFLPQENKIPGKSGATIPGQGGLYEVFVPMGGRLAKFKDKEGYLGGVLTKNGAVGGGQAILKPFEGEETLAIDPEMLIMLAMMACIYKKLDAVQETQQEILDFLKQKEESELKGDLSFLSDLLSNFRFNWDNDQFRRSNHIKALDIKQSSAGRIDFYGKRIKTMISRKSFLNSDKNVTKQINKLGAEFKNMELSVYLFAFSSFVEVMLLGNFDTFYLESVVSKIESHSENYRNVYTQCYNLIEAKSDSSIQSSLLRGLASLSTIAGKTAAKIPLVGDSSFDETLIEAGKKLENKISVRTGQTMQEFLENQIDLIKPFLENIRLIDNLHNKPVRMLFDNTNIYVEDLA